MAEHEASPRKTLEQLPFPGAGVGSRTSAGWCQQSPLIPAGLDDTEGRFSSSNYSCEYTRGAADEGGRHMHIHTHTRSQLGKKNSSEEPAGSQRFRVKEKEV